jgi:hypothetical protein
MVLNLDKCMKKLLESEIGTQLEAEQTQNLETVLKENCSLLNQLDLICRFLPNMCDKAEIEKRVQRAVEAIEKKFNELL